MKTEDIKLFHAIVDSGSLIRASEIFNLPKSNLSRRIKSLEDELNLSLFHRHQRSMMTTDAGKLFYQKTKPLISELDATVEALTNPTFELKGNIRVQLLPLPDMARMIASIFEFMQMHPKLHIEIIASSEEHNMIENRIDLAFRIGQQLEDSQLIARPLRTVTTGFFATPEYLENVARPQTPEDLKNLDFILYRHPSGHVVNSVNITNELVIPIKGRLIFNHLPMMLEACLQHQGVIHFPDHIGYRYVKDGKLVRLLKNIEPMLNVGWLVYPQRSTLSLASRTLIDFLVEKFKNIELDDAIEISTD